MRGATPFLLAASAILLAHPKRMNAQNPASPAPTTIVQTAFRAYQAKHWTDFASLVHADALAEFRRQNLEMAELWDAHAGEMNEARKHADLPTDLGNPMLRLFAGVKTLSELRALSPQEFLARYLEARSPKADPRDPEYQPPVTTREIIGEVTETPDLVHVVYRVRTDVGKYGRTESIDVVPVKRAASGWQLMLNSELSFTGSGMMMVNDSSKE